jgi:hypothetical protein
MGAVARCGASVSQRNPHSSISRSHPRYGVSRSCAVRCSARQPRSAIARLARLTGASFCDPHQKHRRAIKRRGIADAGARRAVDSIWDSANKQATTGRRSDISGIYESRGCLNIFGRCHSVAGAVLLPLHGLARDAARFVQRGCPAKRRRSRGGKIMVGAVDYGRHPPKPSPAAALLITSYARREFGP